MKYLIIFLFFVIGYSSIANDKKNNNANKLVESWNLVKVEKFNLMIDKGITSNEKWSQIPEQIILKLFGNSSETLELNLSLKFNRNETPDEVVVILTRGGFLDDSVQGDWHKVKLKKSTKKVWKITEINKATRCWRQKTKKYQKNKCK